MYKYAIANEKGDYVAHTNDYGHAEMLAADINDTLDMENKRGSAAVMTWTEGHYELVY